jgi:hypothetical protein
VAYRLNQRFPITVQPKTMIVFLPRLLISVLIGDAERAAQQIYQCGLEYSGQQSDRDRSSDNHNCPRWKRAMLTLPPPVLQDMSVEMKNLDAVTNWTTQQLHADLGAGGEPAEDLLDRALASMENLREAADTVMLLLGELLKSA